MTPREKALEEAGRAWVAKLDRLNDAAERAPRYPGAPKLLPRSEREGPEVTAMRAALALPVEEGTRDPFDAIAAEAASELRRARTKHAPMRGAHEGWAVIFEEVDELWDEVKRRQPDPAAMRKESIQIAAMGLAFALEVCDSAAPRAPAEPPQKVTPQATRTKPWSTACACSDYSRCVYHQEHPDEAPRAPSTTPPLDVMVAARHEDHPPVEGRVVATTPLPAPSTTPPEEPDHG